MATIYRDKEEGTQRHVEVTEITDDEFKFHALGGGFNYRMSKKAFLAKYRESERPTDFTEGLVGLDEFPHLVAAYLMPGDRWNGFAKPYFTKKAGLELTEICPWLTYNAADDTFNIQLDEEGDAEENVVRAMEIEVDGAKVQVYPIGTGSFVWDDYPNPIDTAGAKGVGKDSGT